MISQPRRTTLVAVLPGTTVRDERRDVLDMYRRAEVEGSGQVVAGIEAFQRRLDKPEPLPPQAVRGRNRLGGV